jgi:hypothetical protein
LTAYDDKGHAMPAFNFLQNAGIAWQVLQDDDSMPPALI